ncbi:DUF1934 domain-containing protein [Macrococcoides bohemicum]|uniref:DUF1934 domain-containing protein n=1 Tax=Macrococcoides bohemicum TaxID=1903056 RepID=A0AAE7Q4U5_9STAP|nr:MULTISPECIES: DUF1934 domain-containing protein [Macrococcus]ATD31796.1 hypothetical protein BHM04_11650 [Macrococcus sp. IME1552]MBC9875296.1 DUF1934 domain-containing protein [Macrococcus bohemicus]QRN50777.1 DUF1934 domain-containing protein [Macrococcus bohemicus]QYA42232.1 DUF1934 domain-containing protein [Macrococcus bohemicus]QYA44622.1 DUF1934 domain-containing protein [Macrococcus bohemicus]
MNIEIHIKQQITNSEGTETFDLITTGTLIKKAHTYIMYKETIDDILTDVRVKVEDERVRINRKGQLTLDFLFVPYETTQNMYHLANQKTVMEVTTNQMFIESDEHSGKVYIQYTIVNNQTVLGSYTYDIEYKERV